MKQWPLILLIPGLVAIIVMAFFPARKVLACIPLGYIGGFAISMLFQSEGVDPGDGRTSKRMDYMDCFISCHHRFEYCVGANKQAQAKIKYTGILWQLEI